MLECRDLVHTVCSCVRMQRPCTHSVCGERQRPYRTKTGHSEGGMGVCGMIGGRDRDLTGQRQDTQREVWVFVV